MGKNVALVLSGGGARGIAHIGVIEELLEQGYTITSIAGTSMGSMVGAMYALGKMEDFKQWICALDRQQVFRLVDFSFSNKGLIKGERVLNAIKEFIPDKNIEELEMPYAAVAVDILNREEIVFTSGSIFEAIRASISIPTVFKPVPSGDRLLVDGGVLNNIPLNRVVRHEGDLLFGSYVNAAIPKRKIVGTQVEQEKRERVYQQKLKQFQEHLPKINPRQNKEDNFGFFDVISKTLNTAMFNMANDAIERTPNDMVVMISRDSSGTYDFYKAEELVEIGRLQTRDYLKEFHKQEQKGTH